MALDLHRVQRNGLAEGLRIRAQIKLLKLTRSSVDEFLSATNRGSTALHIGDAFGMPLGLFKLLLSEWLLAQHKPHVLAWAELEEACSEEFSFWDLKPYVVQYSDETSSSDYKYQGLRMLAGQVWLRGIQERSTPDPINA